MANRYFVTGSAGNNNWGQSGVGSNWSLTSGGAGGQAVPIASDDVFLDGNSPSACVIDTTGRVCKSITTTGWTGSITMTNSITVSGAITLTSNTTFTGTAKLEGIIAASHTSGGAYIPNFGLRGAVTHTMADDFNVGTFFLGTTTNATVVNGNKVYIGIHLDMSLSSTGTLSGTSEFVMNGTGSIKYPSSTGVLRNNLTFDTSGTVTFDTGTFRYNTGTIAYNTGTVDANNCDLVITVATTLNCGSNVSWRTLTVTGTTTLTLSSDCYVSGLVTLGGTTLTTTISGAAYLRCGGGLVIGGTTAIITGAAIIVLTGTGTFQASTTTGLHTSKIWIDAGAGTITTSGTVRYPFDLIKYISGTVITAAGTWSTSGGGSGGTKVLNSFIIGAMG